MAFLDKARVMEVLLPAVKQAMERSMTLQKILLYGYTKSDANDLDKSMNQVLGRRGTVLRRTNSSSSVLSSSDMPTSASTLCQRVSIQLEQSKHLIHEHYHPLLYDFMTVLGRDEDQVRSFELGILGRRLAEMIVDDLIHISELEHQQGDATSYATMKNQRGKSISSSSPSQPVLARRIQQLSNHNVPGWIISYLNVLRSLGNESAHESPPPQTSSTDASARTLMQGSVDSSVVWNCIPMI